MTTTPETFRPSAGLRRAGAALAALLCATALHAQQQIATVIAAGLNQPGFVAGDPNNNIYLTDSVNNRIVKFVPLTNGLFTLAGFGHRPARPEQQCFRRSGPFFPAVGHCL